LDQTEVSRLYGGIQEERTPDGIRMDAPYRTLESNETEFVLDAVRKFFDYLEARKYKLHVRVFLSRYRGFSVCPDCNGSRLRQEARNIFIDSRERGKNIADVVAMTIQQAAEFFSTIELTESQNTIAERILWEIRSRLKFLNDVGLQYLTLDRLASTLSGGETQRIQLATSLGSSLSERCMFSTNRR
jgi:excinuclease ABC subunit A